MNRAAGSGEGFVCGSRQEKAELVGRSWDPAGWFVGREESLTRQSLV